MEFPDAALVDLLDALIFRQLLAYPERLVRYIPDSKRCVIIDEIQKVPALLSEVHRLMEARKDLRFILTGSSARNFVRAESIFSPAGSC